MNKITVLHNGGGWTTNIGNAFLDYGSMESIRQAHLDADVHLTSVLNRWVSHHMDSGITGRLHKKSMNISNVLNIQEYGKVDYVTQSGAFLASHWFDLHGEILLKLKEKGVKIIFNGGGMTDTTYNEEEIEKTREWVKKITPYAFISREEMSFETYGDLAEHSYNGIDCAFFLSDSYAALQLDIPSYIVKNFDRVAEPDLYSLNVDDDKHVIRTHHSFWHNFNPLEYMKMKKNYYGLENTMISEIPEDYLNLYANSDGTYSDRVHACVATFSYGNPARLVSDSPRSLLFDRINAGDITEKLLEPDMTIIKKEKDNQVAFLAEILNG